MATAKESPVLAARRLSVGYSGQPVVSGLELQLYPGEVVGLLGANGVGKTTTLMTLAGNLPSISGEVHWLGAPTTAPLHRRARSGMRLLTEHRSIFPSLSVRDNLKLGRSPERRYLELFPELERLMTRRAGLLSGGEQQMLALALAVGDRPRVLLADELSLGLAPLIVARLLKVVRGAAEQGCGVLLVEQQVQAALSVADRGYVIKRGRVVLEGTTAELADRRGELESSYLAGAALDASQQPTRTEPGMHDPTPEQPKVRQQ